MSSEVKQRKLSRGRGNLRKWLTKNSFGSVQSEPVNIRNKTWPNLVMHVFSHPQLEAARGAILTPSMCM